jgi:hypothetical protein
MKIAPQFMRVVIVLAALAAGSAFNVARGNHYILPCTPDCREASEIAISSGITGSWFDPSQNGQGFAIEVLPGQPLQMTASWFVFRPGGGQSWIIAQGPVTGARAELQGYQMAGPGGRFPPAFDQAGVHSEFWGTLTFTFMDCNHGHMTWASSVPGYSSGTMNLDRLTLPAGLTCAESANSNAAESSDTPH